MAKFKDGIQDPNFSDCMLIPASSKEARDLYMVNKFNKDNVAYEHTYLRVTKKNGTVRCLVNILPDKSHVAWATCSNCLSWFAWCTCKDGIKNPRYILAFYNQADNLVNGTPLLTANDLHRAIPEKREQLLPNLPKVKRGGFTKSDVKTIGTLMSPPNTTPKVKKPKVTKKLDKSFEQEGLDVSRIDSNTIDKSAKGIADTSTNDLMDELLADTKSKKSKKSNGK